MTNQPIAQLLNRLWQHISPRRRGQFMLLLGLILVSTLIEVVSLGAVMPFIGVLVTPDKIIANPVVAKAAMEIGINSAEGLVFPLTVAFVAMAILSGGIRLLVLRANTRYSFSTGVDISLGIYRRTLYQSYKMHTSRNSSEVVSAVTNKASTVVTGVLLPLLTLISSVIILVAIIVLLILVDPKVAVTTALGFAFCYGILALIYRRKLQLNSITIAAEQTKLFKTLNEGLGGIRDVLLDGTQSVYSDLYNRADSALRRAQGSNTFISASPRFTMEALGMVLIALLAYSVSRRPGGVESALPLLGVLAMGAQRLIPALQQGYASWTTILGNAQSLADTINLLEQPLPIELSQTTTEIFSFTDSIQFDKVGFSYFEGGEKVIDCFHLTVPKGARVGLIGETGSGKSTIVDLLMGLLEPTEGQLRIDGIPITGHQIRLWQQNIAHVPQAVFLADSSVAENIAFGVEPMKIDMALVKDAARRAQVADFIENTPEGYQTFVGERGVRLSGGQRQRIGIARALYKKAEVLVFDEATSALDSATEQAVMHSIEHLGSDLTIFIIAHRLSTLRNCTKVIEINKGRIQRCGSYNEIIGH